ncbi:MAG: hypothetical protein R3Y64_10260 [Peptostreptococcaceae bacterium]
MEIVIKEEGLQIGTVVLIERLINGLFSQESCMIISDENNKINLLKLDNNKIIASFENLDTLKGFLKRYTFNFYNNFKVLSEVNSLLVEKDIME